MIKIITLLLGQPGTDRKVAIGFWILFIALMVALYFIVATHDPAALV